MNNKKIIFLIVIISLIITISVAMLLLDTTGDINQGNYRINDMVVNSYANIGENKENEEAVEISDLTFSLSQNNKITMLVAKNVDATQIYLDNIKVSEPLKKGNLSIWQTDTKEKYELNSEFKNMEISPIQKDNQYYIELNIDNIDFLTDVKAPADTKKITFDGTFFNELNIKLEDIQMKFECDLNIVDITGKKSTCKLKFNFPPEELLVDGISVLRQDISRYVFKLK